MDKKKEPKGGEENMEKYFDEEQYITGIVSPDGNIKPLSKNDAALEELISLLCSGNHEHKDAALELLRSENNIETMLDAITQTGNKKHKAALIAACWESGMDLKENAVFFASLATDPDLFVSLEAITVIDTMAIEDIALIKEILKKLDDKGIANHPNALMLNDLKQSLEEKTDQTT
jgi:hypothetical protein